MEKGGKRLRNKEGSSGVYAEACNDGKNKKRMTLNSRIELVACVSRRFDTFSSLALQAHGSGTIITTCCRANLLLYCKTHSVPTEKDCSEE